jgi:hypothetical protein
MRRTRTALCVGLGLLFVAMWASAECPSVQGGLTDILGLALVLLAAIYGAIFAPTMKLWRSGVTGKNHRGRNLKPGPARAEGKVDNSYPILDIGPVIKHRYHGEATWTILDDLDAFLQEHRRCGKLDANVEGAWLWMSCECGAGIARRLNHSPADPNKRSVTSTL